MRGQGEEQSVVDAIALGDLSKVKLSPMHTALLKFVKLVTQNSARTQDSDVQEMRDAGWSDEQIWEASLEIGIFSMLNRMADVHGLDYPAGGWQPPAAEKPTKSEDKVK